MRDLECTSEPIKTAERLGYFYNDKRAHATVTKQIEELRHVITGTSRTETLFESAKNSMKTLLDKFKGRQSKQEH